MINGLNQIFRSFHRKKRYKQSEKISIIRYLFLIAEFIILIKVYKMNGEDIMELTKRNKNIEGIKDIDEDSVPYYWGLYNIFFVYGITHGITEFLKYIAILIWNKNGICGYINFGLELTCSVFILAFFLRFIRRENKNKYYVDTISIWGTMAVSIPFLMFGVRLTISLFNIDKDIRLLPRLSEQEMFIDILLLCIATISVGNIIDQKWMRVLSIVILFIFLMVYIISNNFANQEKLNIAVLYYLIIFVFGYISLGLILFFKGIRYKR